MNLHAFWRAVLAQDAEAIRPFFAADATIRWHCTNELFTVDEFLRANCEYPGRWDGETERVCEAPGQAVTVTRVFSTQEPLSFHAVSFFTFQNDLIHTLDEYWGDDGEPPRWRLEKRIGRRING